MFVSSGVKISIRSIDVHIGHESNVGVYFARRDHEYIESNRQYATVTVMFVCLVLVFAATPKEMALRSVFV